MEIRSVLSFFQSDLVNKFGQEVSLEVLLELFGVIRIRVMLEIDSEIVLKQNIVVGP